MFILYNPIGRLGHCIQLNEEVGLANLCRSSLQIANIWEGKPRVDVSRSEERRVGKEC